MALIIENKDMPKCCEECFALDDYFGCPRCRITNELRSFTFDTLHKRMGECPLKELKQEL